MLVFILEVGLLASFMALFCIMTALANLAEKAANRKQPKLKTTMYQGKL